MSVRRSAAGHRFFVLVAALVAVAASIWIFRTFEGSAAKQQSRTLQARLSGSLNWAPFIPIRHRHVEANGKFRDAVDEAHESLRTPRIAAAELLVGHTRTALSTLTTLSETTSKDDKGVWNDLAVARFEGAARYDAPDLLADALAACDHALRIDATAPEPLFNRALILERLGLRDDARIAWNRYLLADGSSGWAVEAQEHVRALEPEVRFMQRLDRLSRNVPKVRVQNLATDDPQDARAYGVMEVLARWGSAFQSRQSDAEQHLNIARVLGAQVAVVNGDHFLQRAVDTIDASTEERRAILAGAHVDYREGMNASQASRPSDAEPLLRRAAEEFDRGGSPAALVARYFAANTVFEQGHKDEAQRQLEQLLPAVSADFPSLRAQVIWEIGVCHASRADWGEAIRLLDESASSFDRLRESDYAGSVRRLISFIYDRVGDPRTAWQVRMLALRDIGRRSDRPLEKAVGTIADAAILDEKWETAESFLTLQADIAHRLGQATHLTDALITRAVVRSHIGDDRGANEDQIAAEATFASIQDPAYKKLYQAARLRLRALLARAPSDSVALLTEAIDYQSSSSDRSNLPPLFLERGRARKKLNDMKGADEDFAKGINELEKHRDSLPPGETRWGAFHAAEELFDEAMELALDRRDVVRAFAIAERKRARSLLETYRPQPAFEVRNLPSGVEFVEFATAPERLVIFVADRVTGVYAIRTNCTRLRLRSVSSQLIETIRTGDRTSVRRIANLLYGLLIEPVASRLASPKVVLIPDERTAVVPFAALIDNEGRYLIERHALVVAPSAAVYAAGDEGRTETATRRTVLILTTGSGGSDSLSFVDDEAKRIARSYMHSVRLDGSYGKFDDLSKKCNEVDVLHFGGHAVGDDDGLEPASIVVKREAGRETRIDVADIARLHLRRDAVVVLAGCNTARGDSRASEGVVSVAYGFLSAGARSVVASLWPIDDRIAASFFPHLHDELAVGVSPSKALRALQLEAIRSNDFPTPFWAALQDYGN
jgi:CHAT domain-containing protein